MSNDHQTPSVVGLEPSSATNGPSLPPSSPFTRVSGNTAVSVTHRAEPLPLDKVFYSADERSYAVLQSCRIKNVSRSDNRIALWMSDLVDTIILDGFPTVQYILNVNGSNVCTAFYRNGQIVFDLNRVRNGSMAFLKAIKRDDGEPAVTMAADGTDRFLLPMNNCHCDIIFPKGTELDGTEKIILQGYHPDQAGDYGLYKTMTYKHYVHTYYCPTSDVIETITVETQGCYPVALRIGSDEFWSQSSGVSMLEKHVFRLRDPQMRYMGKQNNYLSEYINKNTLNCDRAPSMFIITEASIKSVVATKFDIRSYPNHEPLFRDD